MTAHKFLLTLALLLPLGLTGCGDSHEAVMDDMTKLTQQFNEIIGSVNDKASAEAAAEKIKSLSSESKAIAERMKKLGPLSAEKAMELGMKAISNMDPSSIGDQMKNMMKVMSNPEIRDVLQPAIDEYHKAMADANPVGK